MDKLKVEKPVTQTLGEFILAKQNDFKYSSGELSCLLGAIELAAKVVNKEVNKAGLVDILGDLGHANIQGEEQQKLDAYANEIFISALRSRKVVCGVTSEENENYISILEPDNSELKKKYVVLIDPLDGSSNIDVNVNVGTIFSIYRRLTPDNELVQLKDFLQPGNQQVAAGYIVYGSSTMLVYTTGMGVNGFTLDTALGEFYLSHPNMKFPKDGRIYSINEGNYIKFPDGIKKYIKYCQAEKEGGVYISRYVGSLVADFHRNLIKGGVYLYPSNAHAPKGKLRLLYECNPMSFLAEQAGGKGSDGFRNILNIKPHALHERTPFICGSKEMVDEIEHYMEKYSSNESTVINDPN